MTKMTWMTVFTDTTLMTHQMIRMTLKIWRTVPNLFTKLDDFDDLDDFVQYAGRLCKMTKMTQMTCFMTFLPWTIRRLG